MMPLYRVSRAADHALCSNQRSLPEAVPDRLAQKAGSHPGSMDGSRHDAHVALDYTFNVHHKDTNGDGGAPYPIRNDSTGSFPEDFPGDSPYGSVGGSLVRAICSLRPSSKPLAERVPTHIPSQKMCLTLCPALGHGRICLRAHFRLVLLLAASMWRCTRHGLQHQLRTAVLHLHPP